jgi:hypothetical protein
MSLLSLDQMLMLAGTLDDVPGYDTARERFRRFLLSHATQVATVRSLIEQAQHTPGDQHFRALHDLIGVLGRPLGFEVHFAGPAPLSAAVRPYIIWEGGRDTLVVMVPSPRMPWPTTREIGRGVAALRERAPSLTAHVAALLVIPPFVSAPRGADEEPTPADDATNVPTVRTAHVSLSRLLSLADIASTGRVTHNDVIKLMQTGTGLDDVVGVIERTATPAGGPMMTPQPATTAVIEHLSPRTGYWLASVVPDQAMTPEEFLEVVVGRRQIFGVADESTQAGTVRSGDSVCFFINRKGVVGQARVGSTAEAGGGLRDARRFRQILRLERIQLHVDTPLALDAETELRLRRLPSATLRHAPLLLEISAESFRDVTGRPAAAVGGAATVVPFDPAERQG